MCEQTAEIREVIYKGNIHNKGKIGGKICLRHFVGIASNYKDKILFRRFFRVAESHSKFVFVSANTLLEDKKLARGLFGFTQTTDEQNLAVNRYRAEIKSLNSRN